jgi:hypothetical protein
MSYEFDGVLFVLWDERVSADTLGNIVYFEVPGTTAANFEIVCRAWLIGCDFGTANGIALGSMLG